MEKVLKTITEEVTEQMLQETVNNYIYVPINYHNILDELENKNTRENVWFAGYVVGYSISHLTYDFEDGAFCEPFYVYNIVMKDGKSYMLSPDECQIEIISEERFDEMVAEIYSDAAIERELDNPVNIEQLQKEKEKSEIIQLNNGLLLPGKDF